MSEQPFEELVARLDACARKLETGNLPLEEALATYEEGAALVAQIRELLEGAEQRIQRLRSDLQDGPAFREDLEPYDAGDLVGLFAEPSEPSDSPDLPDESAEPASPDEP